jgi:signal transduction histidine kinase/CheY-like chemotaxis protein
MLATALFLGAYPAHRSGWRSNAELHTLLEAISALMAFTAGAMALVRYYAKKSTAFLMLGSCFLGAGLLDACHGLITSSFFAGVAPYELAALTPWSGVISRVFMSLLMCAILLAPETEIVAPARVTTALKETVVYVLIGSWAVISFLFFALVPMPPAFYPSVMIHRPVELIPAALFALATVGYLWKGTWKTRNFEHWLVLSLIVATAGEFAYMPFYVRLYDAQFVFGHVVKILVYFFVIAGLFENTFSIFKRAEENAAQLEARVQERTEELSGANIKLAEEIVEREGTETRLQEAIAVAESASRAKGEFLANMSHEIRTPLNGVMGMTDLVLDTSLTNEQREYLETVKTSADSLLTVVNDILDFSKIESGKFDLAEVDFNLRDCLKATLRTLEPRARQKGLELRCNVDSDVPEAVRGDANRLRQIVINLVGNAVKFTSVGEVAVKLRTVENYGGTCVLELAVVDTGIGIPLEKQKLIFEPFTQADTSTTRKYGGTGLGLSISTRLAAMMGGGIRVESEPARLGTCFYLTIKLKKVEAKVVGAEVAEAAVTPRPATREVPLTKRSSLNDDGRSAMAALRILLVEDNAVNHRLVTLLLEKRRHQVVVAENGREALAAMENSAFDVVLMEVQMPEMDGLEATAAIRAGERHSGKHQMVIALTAHAMKGDQERCVAAGMDGYLSKPIRPQELDIVLENIAKRRSAVENVDSAGIRSN